MKQSRFLGTAVVLSTLCTAAACTEQQRADVDTAAGAVESAARATLSVIDVDMGRRIGADSTIAEKTDEFTTKDTIYASVHTSGTANNAAVMARWTAEDGSVIDEQTNTVSTSGDARTVFRLAKAGGLSKGRYTLRVMIDGREVRSKEITVE